MSQYLADLDHFIASKVWIFAPVAAAFTVLLLINVLDLAYQTVCAFVVPYFYQPELRQCGEWAVVTGATDGIGKGYCRCLAERGLNIVIISRNPERLQRTSEELTNEYGIKVHSVRADFRRGWKLYDDLATQLKGKEIGILVNNVGKAISINRRFHCQRPEAMLDLITINIESFVVMTAIILPQMLKRKRGIIVGVSSFSILHPNAMLSIYGASKSALTSLTRALYYEYKTDGINFQCLVPSCVTTKIGLIKHCSGTLARALVPSPDTYCRSAVRTLGLSSFTTGYWPHSIQWMAFNKRFADMLLLIFRKFIMKDQLCRG